MLSATLTNKGQITVPKPVREALGLRPGDRLAFHIREDGTILIEADRVDLMSLRGMLKPKIKGVTLEVMNEAIRKSASGA